MFTIILFSFPLCFKIEVYGGRDYSTNIHRQRAWRENTRLLLRVLDSHLVHFVRVRVTSEVNLSIERPIANLAWKRFEARMFSTVCDKVTWLAERFAALQTLVGLLSRVNISVFFHVRFLVKSLSAVIARERSRIRMNKHMGRKRRWSFERLVALFALECSFVRVDLLVLFQTHCMAECFSANVARERAPSRMRASHVHLQSMRRTKHLFAVQAIKSFSVVGLFRFLLFACDRLCRPTCKHLGLWCRARKMVSKEGWLPERKRKSSLRQERLGWEAHKRRREKLVERISHKLGGKMRKIRLNT